MITENGQFIVLLTGEDDDVWNQLCVSTVLFFSPLFLNISNCVYNIFEVNKHFYFKYLLSLHIHFLSQLATAMI